MTTYVRYVPEERLLDLAAASAADMRLIADLHEGRPWLDDRQVLECLATEGDRAMYIRYIAATGRYWFAHFAGGGHGAHEVVPESEEHKRQKEYWCRAAEEAGLRAETEVSTGTGTRLDVAIMGGSVLTGIEVQRVRIADRSVKTRTTKSFNAGYLPIWFNDWGERPRWLYQVPAMGCGSTPWDKLLPRARSVIATGLTDVEAVKCVIGAFERCPAGNYRPCGEYHARRRPWLGLTIDDVAQKIPVGEVVPLRGSDRSVYLMSPESFRRYQDLVGGTCKWVPGGKTKGQGLSGTTPKECKNPTHSSLSPLPLPREEYTADRSLLPTYIEDELQPGSQPWERRPTRSPRQWREPRQTPGTCAGGCGARPPSGAEYCQACRLIAKLYGRD